MLVDGDRLVRSTSRALCQVPSVTERGRQRRPSLVSIISGPTVAADRAPGRSPPASVTTRENRGVPTMAVVTMRQLLESGVHFGHQTRRWNPKMKRFIFT